LLLLGKRRMSQRSFLEVVIIDRIDGTLTLIGVQVPLPSPLTTRPTISIGNEYAAACSIPPVAEMRAPTHSVFLLPSQSPRQAVKMQVPRSKLLMKIPSMLGVDNWGKAPRKWGEIRMPAMMPWRR
jgi:hypothetical protein